MLTRMWRNWVIYAMLMGRQVKWYRHSGKKYMQFLTKLNMYFTSDPAIPLLGIYSRKVKTYIYTTTCTQMISAALVVITPNWK